MLKCILKLSNSNFGFVSLISLLLLYIIKVDGSNSTGKKETTETQWPKLSFEDILDPSELVEKFNKYYAYFNRGGDEFTFVNPLKTLFDPLKNDGTYVVDPNADGPVVVNSWFKYSSYTLAWTVFGTAFLATCAAIAYWYVIFVVTDPDYLHRRKKRSGDRLINGNVLRVLRALSLAFDTYEKLDLEKNPCKEKIFCQFQEKEDIPEDKLWQFMTQVLFVNILKFFRDGKEYEAAKRENGMRRRSGREDENYCSENYSTCQFSLPEFKERLARVFE